jgi:N6-adenosine-specific RNA methylase IME4
VQKFPTLSLKELMLLPVEQIASDASVLFLWATVPLGKEPYELMETWGFSFKTEWFWHKVGRKGTGYWTRGEVEKLLIGTSGTVPAWRSNFDNYLQTHDALGEILDEKPTAHSRKPVEVIRRIEQLTPTAGRRCELFASEYSASVANHRTCPTCGEPCAHPWCGRCERALPTLWECFGLELGHDFRDPKVWGGEILMPKHADSVAGR